MSDALVQAPGAKAAKVCGILAVVLALTCIGIPVALVLGVVALVQHSKAKRLAKAEPEVYLPVPATGLVTGILGLALPVILLPFAGIVGAIAIPALLSQREVARERAVIQNLQTARMEAERALDAFHDRSPNQTPSAEAILRALVAEPAILALRNPYAPGAPAFQQGVRGPLGTVMVQPEVESQHGVTTWLLKFRVSVTHGGQPRLHEGEVTLHTQEQVQQRTEDGWDVVQAPAEPPTPQAP